MKFNLFSKKKLVIAIATVLLLSVTYVGSVFAAYSYTTANLIQSKGKIVYHDEATGDTVTIDAGDFIKIANRIDEVEQDFKEALNN